MLPSQIYFLDILVNVLFKFIFTFYLSMLLLQTSMGAAMLANWLGKGYAN